MQNVLKTGGWALAIGIVIGVSAVVMQSTLPYIWPSLLSTLNWIVEGAGFWQDFLGALIGASVAILLFLLAERQKARDRQKDHLHLLHRSIGGALENLREIDETIFRFSEEKIPAMIADVDFKMASNQPAINYAFVPLLHVFDISDELLRRFSGSGYIDMVTILLINRSKDLRKVIDDINRQFESTTSLNSQIALSGLNENPNVQNESFRNTLVEFKTRMLDEELRGNIRVYAELLIRAQVAVGKMTEWGQTKWATTFKHLPRNTQEIYDGVSRYFAAETDARKREYQSGFRTDLFGLRP